MPHFDTRPQIRVLDLAKVAHVHPLAQVCSGAQMPKGAYVTVLFHNGFFNHRQLNFAAVSDGRVADHGPWPDGACLTNAGLALQEGVRPDDRVGPDLYSSVHVGCLGVDQGHARRHPPLVDAPSHLRFAPGQFEPVIQANHLQRIGHSPSGHPFALIAGDGYELGQIVLSAGAWPDGCQARPQPRVTETKDAATHLANGFLLGRGLPLLDNGQHPARPPVAHDAAIVSRIGRPGGEDGRHRARALVVAGDLL